LPPASRLRIALLLAIAIPATAFAWYRLRSTATSLQPTTDAVATEPSRGRAPVSASTKRAAWRQLITSNFAGDRACVECHPAISAAHQRSGHSHTLMPMEETPLAAKLVAQKTYQDPLRDQTFQFSWQDDRLVVQTEEAAAVPVTWLLGSGTHAQTPVAVDEATQTGIEMR
jgi:hypothetical protein